MFELKIRKTSSHMAKPIMVQKTKKGCWSCLSHGAKDHNYILIWFEGKRQYLHRIVYRHYKGELTTGKPHVMHSCDNPICCNPDHLTAGTHRQNMLDMHKKGRSNPRRGTDTYNSKLTEIEAAEIKYGKESAAFYARKYGVSQPLASNIRNGKKWKHI